MPPRSPGVVESDGGGSNVDPPPLGGGGGTDPVGAEHALLNAHAVPLEIISIIVVSCVNGVIIEQIDVGSVDETVSDWLVVEPGNL